ncbi:oxidoreductase [Roseisolibacter agri]|uniref:Short-chain dehydrogenase/reductase n=1 Tax=Roseisolibacter agri TaxID=2014610 RepID=A0AA37V1U1_9BACT|nr:oxidoreductase [Roseisolibacter agri]GLC26785.1 short-chain dehydrogenase/reductase [Roseisolibacter agri]
MQDTKDTPVWFITGCSTGFGRELARAVLDRGYRCVVTARNPDSVRDIAEAHGERALVAKLDVTVPAEVEASVRAAEERFGRIDVLVNNAGIGYFGAIEESDEAEVRRMFEINVFGLGRMTNAVLPGMRRRRAGHVVNIASIGGIRAFPGVGWYNATKFAVVGLSEALSLETAPLGIKVTVVEPSGFRTDWAGRSANDATTRIADYAETAHTNQGTIRGYSGKQPGDPVRAAAAIIAAVEAPEPPLHLLLGKGAMRGARWKLDLLKANFDAWEATTVGADFPEGS